VQGPSVRVLLSGARDLVLGIALFLAFCVFVYLVLELQAAIWHLLGL
jgi:hypothetical protein